MRIYMNKTPKKLNRITFYTLMFLCSTGVVHRSPQLAFQTEPL